MGMVPTCDVRSTGTRYSSCTKNKPRSTRLDRKQNVTAIRRTSGVLHYRALHGDIHGAPWSSMSLHGGRWRPPWRSVEAPWRSVETSMEVGGGSMEVGGDLHGGPGRLHGGRWRPPWRSVEAPWRSVEAPWRPPWRSVEAPWRLMDLHEPPWSSMSLHGAP